MQLSEPDELALAIAIASEVHADQVDKGGHPYIDHPMAVMKRQSAHRHRVVAVLHDVIEDGRGVYTKEKLIQRGITAGNAHSVDCISRRNGETYHQYLQRVLSDDVALDVKIDDISENMDLSRIPVPTPKDLARTEQYRRKRTYLIDTRAFRLALNAHTRQVQDA